MDATTYLLDSNTGQQTLSLPPLSVFDPNNTTNSSQSTTPFYILNASTGNLLWHSSMPSGPFMLLADALYTIQPDGRIDAWRDSDGQRLWSYRAPAGSTLYASPDPGSSQLFLLDLTGKLSVLRASDGKPLWRNP
ncbi:MAG TPA: PQQ-binding-like beta-propeller repeat protein [Ktedonobacteraceae bacterium]